MKYALKWKLYMLLHTVITQIRSSICQTNREPLVYCTVTIFSVVFRCIQLQITNRALQLYANYMVFDNYTCKQEPTFANVHLADLSSVRYKTSTWNEIKELIKSNYLIVPSLLNNKSEKYDMEWSVGDEAIFRRTRNCTLERNWNEQPQSSSVFLTLLNVSPEFEQEVVFYFLSHSCMYSAVRPVFFRNF